MTSTAPTSKANSKKFWGVALLLLTLLALFWRSFLPGYVLFANDGPLGQQMTTWSQFPEVFTGAWDDLNVLGTNVGGASVCVSALLRWTLEPLNFAKFLVPLALLILGLGAWAFFRQLQLAPAAAALGALAAMLNSTFFSAACWGVATQEIGIGMVFFALALVVSIGPTSSPLDRWLRLALAGFAVGVNVMEAADIGAIFSLFLAAFVVYHAIVTTEGGLITKTVRGAGRVALIAGCAGLISAYALSGLIGIQIKGVVGMQQDPETKARRWHEATQWSLPKVETLGLVIPGLFGYRMDSPDGANYWGGVGRDPAWDQWYDQGQQGPRPQCLMRFSGGGNYMGVLVILLALWTALQSFRTTESIYSPVERRLLWFWVGASVISLLLAYGRFAPFYQFLYALPYFSTIRNPAKFLNLFSFAVVVVFAYGVHGLSRRPLQPPPAKVPGPAPRPKSGWANVSRFDQRWIVGCVVAVAASLLGWKVYSSSRQTLEQYLELVKPFNTTAAPAEIADFSIQQVGWFVLFLAASVVVVTLILRYAPAGKPAGWAAVLLGIVLVADLGRANLPWIVYWDYPKKYETAGPDPIIQFFRDKPQEHRVAILPEWFMAAFRLPDGVVQAQSRLNGLYTIEWNQQLFPYYNIQTLDIIQRPRTPEDVAAWERALVVKSPDTLRNVGRRWELTNTRYILGFDWFLDLLNTYFDPAQQRFHIAKRFDIVPKPGVTEPTRWEDVTAEPATNGTYAVFEFTGALPRAKLYANWHMAADNQTALNELQTKPINPSDLAFLRQLGTNDFLTLKELVSPGFDPAQAVLLASPVPGSTNAATGKEAGTVEFTSYAPKIIKLQTKSDIPSILLLNDKYDPNWQVWVDGNRAELLRCNFIMRGVYLPAGSHRVEFLFKPAIGPLYFNLAGVFLCVLSLGYVALTSRGSKVPSPPDEKRGPLAAAKAGKSAAG